MSQGYKLYYNLAQRNKTKILAACKQAELQAGPAQFEPACTKACGFGKTGI